MNLNDKILGFEFNLTFDLNNMVPIDLKYNQKIHHKYLYYILVLFYLKLCFHYDF